MSVSYQYQITSDFNSNRSDLLSWLQSKLVPFYADSIEMDDDETITIIQNYNVIFSIEKTNGVSDLGNTVAMKAYYGTGESDYIYPRTPDHSNTFTTANCNISGYVTSGAVVLVFKGNQDGSSSGFDLNPRECPWVIFTTDDTSETVIIMSSDFDSAYRPYQTIRFGSNISTKSCLSRPVLASYNVLVPFMAILPSGIATYTPNVFHCEGVHTTATETGICTISGNRYLCLTGDIYIKE